MNNVLSYDNFLNEEVSKFLKSNYNKIFNESNETLNNLFVNFTKKLDTDKDIPNLYQRYIRAVQSNTQNQINDAESIDTVNKIVSDSIKYFYFSLKPVINKLQNNEFNMESIFEKSRDKRLQVLMSYPEDKFANAVPEFVTQIAEPQIKEESEKNVQEVENTEETENVIERVKNNILKILEADNTEQEKLISYKKSALEWINTSLFDLLKPKMQLLNQIRTNTSNLIDSISNEMKGSRNDNAKKMILNKIINLDSEQLKKLSDFLGFNEEEIGKI